MRRREFIALVGVAFAWPLWVRAQTQQPSQSHRIAFVSTQLPSDMIENNPFYRIFFTELRRLGQIEGDNLIVERYSGSGLKEQYAELAEIVVRQKPDLIFAVTSRFVRALKLATPTIPIVGVMGEPVAWGLVE